MCSILTFQKTQGNCQLLLGVQTLRMLLCSFFFPAGFCCESCGLDFSPGSQENNLIESPSIGQTLSFPPFSPQLQYCHCWPFGSSEFSALSAGFMGNRAKVSRTALAACFFFFILRVDFNYSST